MNIIIDIQDRTTDYLLIKKLADRTESGIRAVCVMYDDHSKDKKSSENVFIKNDNIHYRLYSLIHMYLLLLREFHYSETSFQEINKNNPNKLNNFIGSNPFFDKSELEISSIFDSITFHLLSVFDYLSHLIHYICITDKSNTKKWSSLMKSVRSGNNEIGRLNINSKIMEVNSDFVNPLYEYRSDIIHNKRDKHNFSVINPNSA